MTLWRVAVLLPATFFHEQDRADKKVAKKPLLYIFR